MFIGVKDFIAQYKEPFDREAKAKRIARERLRNKGIVRATKDQIEDEIEEVLEEWVTKANWGINAHKELQEKGLIQYPDAIIEEYKEGKVNNDTPSEAILQINSLKNCFKVLIHKLRDGKVFAMNAPFLHLRIS